MAGTPGAAGLVPTALVERRAALAAAVQAAERPTDLAAMQAAAPRAPPLDPTRSAETAPGYGVRARWRRSSARCS